MSIFYSSNEINRLTLGLNFYAREFDEVERPFVQQLTSMGGGYLGGDLDTPMGVKISKVR